MDDEDDDDDDDDDARADVEANEFVRLGYDDDVPPVRDTAAPPG
jgi:hypothetical protein